MVRIKSEGLHLNDRFRWRGPVMIAIILACLPLQWIIIASAGGLLLKPMHLSIALLFVGVLPYLPSFPIRKSIPLEVSILVILFTAYMASMGLSAFRPGGGQISLIVKDSIYFIVFVILFFVLIHQRDSAIGWSTMSGSLLGITLFLGIASITFAMSGQNFCLEYIDAILSGDFARVRFGIYGQLNRSVGDAELEDSFVSLVNTIVSSFVLYVILLWAYRKDTDSLGWRSITKVIRWTISFIACVLIFGSSSRLNIAVLACSVCFAVSFDPLTRTSRRAFSNALIITLALVISLPVITIAVSSLGRVDEMVVERFSPETLSGDGRWEMYSEAFARISDKWLLGHGLGATLTTSGHDVRVHNLFLASWYEAGIAAFILSVMVFGFVAFIWVTQLLNVIRDPDYWRLPVSAGWVFAMPFLPWAKWMLYSPTLHMTDWCMLAFFFGCFELNRQRASSAVQT